MKKEPKKKVYVLTVSRNFPTTHPRKGEETGFVNKILVSDKKHTVRGNYDLWYKRALEVQAGRAVVSMRYWTGKPYSSKQFEFLQLSYIDVQKVHVYQVARVEEDEQFYTIHHNKTKTLIFIDKDKTPLSLPNIFTANDGLSIIDFNAWFKKPVEDAAIIHFTQFKY